ncbi:MAG: 30S ribosomal protein S12 methylthiotransferase RimO [Desulfovibrionaceae bacterium]|nr:30S ribosomal protein S12 methylthiotransferase RimO [Desulfovibrionaceae bacterium]
MAAYTISLGCPKNTVDTEGLLAALGPGLVPVDRPEAADLVLINTCGFIRPAVEESLAAVLECVEDIKALEPRPVLAVVGCLVSRYGPDLAREIPEVDIWLPTSELERWPALAARALGLEGLGPALPRRVSTGPAHAYLKISEGCSHSCRFCTIPSIRGPLKSRDPDQLVLEARQVLDTGVSELVVIGQDVTAYGRDWDEKDALPGLLDRVLGLSGLSRLRLMYLYPAGLTKGLLDFLARCGGPLVPYFDVPLQHAHPEILAAMGRPFARDPARAVDAIRERFPDAALRSTFIVGYPGETEAHFRALAGFVERVGFHHLGAFVYHPEQGTPAAALPDQVPERVKQERLAAIMGLQAGISQGIMAGYVGRDLDLLVEAAHPEWPGLFTARAWFQAPEVDGLTYVSGPGLAAGRMVRARMEEAKTYDLVALA